MSETGTNYKTYKTIDEQIEYLKESKKIIVDDEDRHCFEERNYISLINPYKEYFSTGRNNKGKLVYKKEANFKELINLINIDDKFAKKLYEAIGYFERKLKNVLFSEICKLYIDNKEKDIHCISYVSEIQSFITKQTELPPQFCSNFNYLYVTEKGNIKKIIDNYNIKRKTDVLIHIYQIATNSSIDGSVLEDHEECSNKLIRHCYKKQQIVPLWIIPNALTMGELQTLFLMLPDEPQKKIISKIMNIDTTKVSSKNVVAFAGQIEQIRKLRNIVNHYEPVLPFLMSEIKTKKIEQSQLFTTLEILFKISPIVDIKPDEIQAKINPSNAKIIRILNVMYKSILS